MLQILVTAITAFVNITLGLFTVLKQPKSATHQIFALLTVIIAGWAVANYFSLHAANPDTTLFWIRTVMVITSPMGPVIYLLVRSFPRAQLGVSRSFFYFLLAICVILMVLATTPLMFSSVSIVDGNITPNPGPAILLFALSFVGGPLLSFITLFFKLRRAEGREKVQTYYLFLGIIATFSLTAITNFIMVIVLKASTFVVFGPLFSLILVGFISYAIVKHQFLDIGLLVARSVAYVMTVLVLGIGFSLSIFGIQSYLLERSIVIGELLSSSAIAMVMMFSFQPLRRYLESKTEAIFYHREYEPTALLKKVNKISTSVLLLKNLVKGFAQVMVDEMKISAVGVVIVRDASAHIFGGIEKKDLEQVKKEHGSTPKQIFMKFKDDLHVQPDQMLVFAHMPESVTKNLMRKLHIEVVLPLVVNHTFIGCLVFKQKLSGMEYSQEDLKTLQLIAPQLAISINNALSFEEIRHFNTTLEDEVNEATKKLKGANKKLEQLDKLKDEFVSVASHELRTPMTAIRSYLWMAIEGKGGPLTDKQRFYLDRAYQSTDRLIKLVNEMLNISRIESGRISLQVEEVSIAQVILDSVQEVQPRADELGIAIDLSAVRTALAEKDFPKALIDVNKIKEVIINMLGNSLKFTPKKGTITFTVQPSVKKGEVQVSIADTGIGISPEYIPSLFQKFGLIADSYQTNQNASQGTGLGLYISKSIIELHEGKIWVESKGKDMGTTFHFTIPISSAARRAAFVKKYQHSEDAGIIHNSVL